VWIEFAAWMAGPQRVTLAHQDARHLQTKLAK
jgi:hypothetical protein